MSLQYDGGDRIRNPDRTDYRVGTRFKKVIETLPESRVPESLVIVGILTGELTPVDIDPSDHREKAARITAPPSAEVPIDTVQRTLWLLGEVRGSLSEERKQAIGRIVSASGLNTPGRSETQESQTSETDESVDSNTDEPNSTAGDIHEDEDGQNNLETNYECEFCAEPFARERELMSHLASCAERPDGARFACDHCDSTYHSQHALDRHVERTHEAEPEEQTVHRCSDCGDEFAAPMDLLKHKENHTVDSRDAADTDDSSDSTSGQQVNDEFVAQDDVGVVDHSNPEDGYGFISTSEVTEDVFFHVSEVSGRFPTEGDLLQYDIRETDRGYEAVDIEHKKRAKSSTDPFASTRTRWGEN
jgi:cold shock CspA family protein